VIIDLFHLVVFRRDVGSKLDITILFLILIEILLVKVITLVIVLVNHLNWSS